MGPSMGKSDLPGPPAAGASGPKAAMDGSAGSVLRWGWYSVIVNLVLIGLHGLVAARSGSLAVTAELVHNFVDLAAAIVVVIGLRVAMQKARAFPYGLYKVENLVAAGLAILIFLTAYEVASAAFFSPQPHLSVDAWMVAMLVVTMAVPLVFSHFEARVAKSANSPALMADAREYRIHAYTTGLALVALISAWLDFPLDRIAALIIVAAIVKTGWDLLFDALRVLLDASLDPATLDKIRAIIRADPMVADIRWITGRNAGRFRFVEAGVILRAADLARAEAAMARIEAAVRAVMPHVERILLHTEAKLATHQCYAVPLADTGGTISEHFGEAPYFAFIRFHRETGMVEEQSVRRNPYSSEEHAKGLRVAEWLVAEKVDQVFVPKPLDGKGPVYVFREAGIDIRQTDLRLLSDLLAQLSG